MLAHCGKVGLGMIGNGIVPGQVFAITLFNSEAVASIPIGGVVYIFGTRLVKNCIDNGTLLQASAAYMCVSPGGVLAQTWGRFIPYGRAIGISAVAGATAGEPAFMDASGYPTDVVPSVVGRYLVNLGYFESTTSVWFNPQPPVLL